jgi:hypothetical protein
MLLTVHLDMCMQWNQLITLLIFSLFSHYTSTCFGFAGCRSSGGNNVYMQQMVRVVHFSWISAAWLASWQIKSTVRRNYCIYDMIYMIWYDTIRYHIYDTIWYMIWYYMIWYDIWYDTKWNDTLWQQYSTHLHTNNTRNTEKGRFGSAGRAPSLRVRAWHLPYN